MFIAPLGMILVLSGQIGTFFGVSAVTAGYIIGIVICIMALILALTSPKRKNN